MANRFSQYVSGSNYAPESFRDMSVVPIALRQRHDNALAAQDDMLLQLNNIQVRDEDRDYYNQKREEITANINGLTDKINTIGAGDSNLLGEFRNMKRNYNKEVSLSGGLGQASDLKKRIDTTRANYMEFGVKQGWTPETTEKNFAKEYNAYNTTNPADKLGNEGFAYGEFNPTYAPKQILPTEYLKNIQPLIGEISKEIAWSNFTPVQHPQTGEISFQQNSGATLSKENLQRLDSVQKAINTELMNPESGLRQSLRYSRPDVSEDEIVKQFLSESDIWIDVMGIEASKQVNQSEPPKFSAGSGGGTKKEGSDEPANLVSTPTGAEVFEGKSITDIVDGTQIRQFEETEKTRPLTEAESAKKTQLILQQNRINDALKSQSTVNEVNKTIRELTGGGFTEKGLRKSTEDAYKALQQIRNNNYTNLKELGVSLPLNKTEQSMAVWRQTTERNLLERIGTNKEILDEAYKVSIPLNDLKYSKLYSIGPGEAGKKTMDIFNANANDYAQNFPTLLENSGGKFTLPGQTELLDTNDSGMEELRNSFANGQIEFNGLDIVDMGSTGSSQLVFKYKKSTGDKATSGMIAIDYDNKSPDTNVLDTWLIEMQKTLNPQGQATVQAIMDNKQLKSLAVDSQKFYKEGFSSGMLGNQGTMSDEEVTGDLSNQYNNGNKSGTNYSGLMQGAGTGLNAIGEGDFADRYDYDPELKANYQQLEKAKDGISSAIPVFGGFFRGIEKAGKGLGTAIGGETGGDVASGILDPFSGQMETFKNKDSSQFEKGLSLAAPFLSGVIASKGRKRTQAKLDVQNAIAQGNQYNNDFKIGGDLNDPKYIPTTEDELDFQGLDLTRFNQDSLNNIQDPTDWYSSNPPFMSLSRENIIAPAGTDNKKENAYKAKSKSMLQYAPVLGDFLNYNDARKDKPEIERLNRLDARFNTDYVDEAYLQNIVGNDFDNTINSLTEASNGSSSALRANILGANSNRTRAMSDAYFKANDINRQQDMQAQQFNLGIDQFNVGQDNQERDINARNKAAVEDRKRASRDAIFRDLGSIGREQTYDNRLQNLTGGYDSQGNYNPNNESYFDRLLALAGNKNTNENNQGGTLSKLFEFSNKKNNKIDEEFNKRYR